MTLEKIKEAYNQTIDIEGKKLSEAKNQIFRVGTIRLLLVVACIVGIYMLWGAGDLIGLLVITTIIIFLCLMKWHNRLFVKKKHAELSIQNAKNELQGLEYDYSPFDGAPEKADASHSFSLDLDLFGNRSLFQSINRTVTTYGKDRLSETILYPLHKKEAILSHQEAIKELSEKPELAATFRATGQMSETQDFDYSAFLEKAKDKKPLFKSFWRLMPIAVSVLSIATILLYAFDVIAIGILLLYWIVMIGISFVPTRAIKRATKLLDKKVDVLRTYSDLFQIIESANFNSSLCMQMQQDLITPQSAHQAIKQLKQIGDNVDQSSTIIGFFFLNPFMLWNVKYAMKVEKWLEEYNQNLEKWFDAIARFDSLISLSIFAYNHPDYTYPTVADSFAFEGKELGHPMLRREVCVKNDISIVSRPFFLVITGANMAGKSTYLRTIGVNMVLAAIGAPVCAASLHFYPFVLVTNLRTSDSLNDNESYFFAELKRLKMIIDRLQSGEELFIILDEILKGTNSEDKQKGSIALMKQLVSLNGNGIIATHDLELGNLEHEFPNAVKDYRFEAEIKDDNLTFSYKMKEGVAQNMNACFLMKKMGITGL